MAAKTTKKLGRAKKMAQVKPLTMMHAPSLSVSQSSGASAGQVSVSDINVTKQVDLGGPQLLQAAVGPNNPASTSTTVVLPQGDPSNPVILGSLYNGK